MNIHGNFEAAKNAIEKRLAAVLKKGGKRCCGELPNYYKEDQQKSKDYVADLRSRGFDLVDEDTGSTLSIAITLP